MKFYFCRLLPPRPDFAQTLSTDEARLMQEHAAYWRGLLEQGRTVIFGPVAAPEGTYGIGILSLPDDDDPKDVVAADPVSAAGFRYEVAPMLQAVTRG